MIRKIYICVSLDKFLPNALVNNQLKIVSLISLLILLIGKLANAQAPNISFVSPQIYFTGSPISPLIPANTGGAVPANIYQQVSTFAGSGASSSYNGTGSASGFNLPSGIGVDAQSNIYVCDYGSGLIRKITPTAQVSSIGNVGTPTGLTADAAGNVYVSSFDNNSIHKITPAGTNSIFVGASGSFNSPGGLNFDYAGDLYLADQKNNKIKKISSTGFVTTIAGTGFTGSLDGNAANATFNNPDGVAVDRAGNVYVADAGNNKIRKITPAGIVSTFAGNGTAGSNDGTGINARLNYPTGITIDPLDNLYVADYRNNRIRKITPAGIVSTLAGNGTVGRVDGIGTNSSFNGPIMLAFDVIGNLFITDFQNNLIRKIALTGYMIDKPLPPGLTFDAKTGIISGTPTTTSPVTDYTVTAYNLFGSSNTIVKIQITSPSSIAFPELLAKTPCDADFNPGATSGLPITYSSSNTQVAEIANGLIHIVGVGTSVITATNGVESKDQTLIVTGFQTPFALIRTISSVVCENTPITFNAATDNIGDNPSYIWMVNNEQVNNNNPTFITTELKDGDEVTLQIINNDYCIPVASGKSNVIRMSILPTVIPTVSIESSANEAICFGKPITFTATIEREENITAYTWFINGLDIKQNTKTIVLSNLNDGDEISCVVASEGNCITNPNAYSNVITAIIRNDCEIVAPNSFSPNGDGINDYWKVTSVGNSDLVKVFNRNGSIVFSSGGYQNPWDGTFNGQQLPVGVYYYQIIAEGGSKKLSGSVLIVR